MRFRPGLVLCALLTVVGCDRLQPSKDAPTPQQTTGPALALSVAEAFPERPESSSGAPPEHLSQQLSMPVPAPRIDKPRRAGVYTPPPGSPERVDLMNALRNAVRNDIGGDPVFVVRDLRSNGEWAFGILEPTWSDGRRIVKEHTPLYRNSSDRAGLDGLRTEAIWRKERGRWQVQAHNIGATDVWWGEYCESLPHGLLPGCLSISGDAR